jgi:formamidopyrimidine-DNA glycosylase
MPELPEVETTVRGLRKTVVGLTIKNVWTDLATKDKRKKGTVADPKFFPIFKKAVVNKKILSAERRAKNILINISGGSTILIHLKMTGYLYYGNNSKIEYAHVVFTLNNRKYLVFSDLRKFGKITLLDPEGKSTSYGAGTKTNYLAHLGPEPLEKNFDLEKLKECLNKKPNGKIKTVLMDQSIIAGIGNIYSDEILWRAGVNPERKVSTLKEKELKLIFKAIKETLAKSIDFGGDSMSDYKNIYGLPGKFQLHHEAYRRTGEKCRRSRVCSRGRKRGCKGIIKRKMVNGRSAHFCSVHQK